MFGAPAPAPAPDALDGLMACCGSRPGTAKRGSGGSSGDSAPLLKRKRKGAAPPATPQPPLVSLGTSRCALAARPCSSRRNSSGACRARAGVHDDER